MVTRRHRPFRRGRGVLQVAAAGFIVAYGSLGTAGQPPTDGGGGPAESPPPSDAAPDTAAKPDQPPSAAREAAESDHGTKTGRDGASDRTAETDPDSPEVEHAERTAPCKPSAATRKTPTLHHAPPSTAPADVPLSIEALLTHPYLVKRALLVFRAGDEKVFRAVEFRRSAPGPYVAVVPAQYLTPAGLAYTVELELRDGRRIAVFASRSKPHAIQIAEDGMDLVEREVAKRVDDRRAVFWSGAEFVSFGTSIADVETPAGIQEQSVDDEYFRVEGGFTYRLLRTVSEFGMRVGVVRGSAPVPVRDLLPGQEEDERFDVGLNYGAPWVRFRMADNWHIDGSLLVNITEVGFSAGAGTTLHIGDPYGSKLSLGVEAIQDFGTRVFSQVDIQAHDRIRVSPIIEVTNMPSADHFGMRLVGEVGVDIGWGFALSGRGGYQARVATSGGPSVGGTLGYAF